LAVITKIQLLRGSRPRYRVSLDSSDQFEISDWTLGRCGLCTGDEITAEKISEILVSESELAAKNCAVNFISYRPRSSEETLVRLVRKGFEESIARRVVKQLQTIGMIDDRTFACMFTRDQIRRKAGRNLIRQKLHLKGIDRQMTDSVLNDLIRPDEEREAARTLAARRLVLAKRSLGVLDPEKRKKRMYDFLIRKGFSFEIAQQTVQQLMKK
jgi:regulatory protein